jgi:hypothetical protein
MKTSTHIIGYGLNYMARKAHITRGVKRARRITRKIKINI